VSVLGYLIGTMALGLIFKYIISIHLVPLRTAKSMYRPIPQQRAKRGFVGFRVSPILSCHLCCDNIICASNHSSQIGELSTIKKNVASSPH
jgi:hypothetical protein